jgi:hypothetical protein
VLYFSLFFSLTHFQDLHTEPTRIPHHEEAVAMIVGVGVAVAIVVEVVAIEVVAVASLVVPVGRRALASLPST